MSQAEFLSEPWIDGLGAVVGEGVAGGPTLAVAHVIDAGRKRKVAFRIRLEDGVVADAGADGGPEPDVAVSAGADRFRELLLGEVAPSVAYMRGDLKIEAEPGVVLDLLAWLDGPAGRSLTQRLADATVF